MRGSQVYPHGRFLSNIPSLLLQTVKYGEILAPEQVLQSMIVRGKEWEERALRGGVSVEGWSGYFILPLGSLWKEECQSGEN